MFSFLTFSYSIKGIGDTCMAVMEVYKVFVFRLFNMSFFLSAFTALFCYFVYIGKRCVAVEYCNSRTGGIVFTICQCVKICFEYKRNGSCVADKSYFISSLVLRLRFFSLLRLHSSIKSENIFLSSSELPVISCTRLVR